MRAVRAVKRGRERQRQRQDRRKSQSQRLAGERSLGQSALGAHAWQEDLTGTEVPLPPAPVGRQKRKRKRREASPDWLRLLHTGSIFVSARRFFVAVAGGRWGAGRVTREEVMELAEEIFAATASKPRGRTDREMAISSVRVAMRLLRCARMPHSAAA